jgi:hypothetical protein
MDILATNADLNETKEQFFNCIKALNKESSIGNRGTLNKSIGKPVDEKPIVSDIYNQRYVSYGGVEIYY